MMNLKKYELDYERTAQYFHDYLKDVNTLSNEALNLLKTHSGKFFTFLPENLEFEQLHQFNAGGKTACLRDETAIFIREFLKSNKETFCIFDDFDAEFKEKESNDLYLSNGLSHLTEIYYAINNKANTALITKCLQYSNAMWHSLCIFTTFDLNGYKEKVLSLNEIEMMCEKSKLFMIGAYDAEGYIYWEKL